MAETIDDNTTPAENTAERRRRRQQLAQTLAQGGMTNVHVISHESAQAILTPKRRALIEVLRTNTPDSVRDLAAAVGRDHGQVSRDLNTLAAHGIVDFEDAGRAKRPFLQHDHVVIEPVV